MAIAESSLTQLLPIAQRTGKAAEHKKESNATVTACIESTHAVIGKVRHEDHHHKDETQSL